MSNFQRIGEVTRVTTELNMVDVCTTGITVPITGVPRGGTTMVAAVVDALGVYLGPPEELEKYHYEDQTMHSPYLDTQRKGVLIRNARYKVWGWKDPAGVFPIQDILPDLRNPHPIIVTRDAVAAAQGEHRFDIEYGVEKPRTQAELIAQVGRWSHALLDFAATTRYPTLLVSYERAMRHPEMFIEEVANFLHIKLTQDRRQRARERIAPQGGYLVPDSSPTVSIKLENILWYYINLDSRPDRREHIECETAKVEIKAERFNALRKENYDGPPENVAKMQATPNTIGNWLSHTAMFKMAARTGRIIGVLEDDAMICDDFVDRLRYVEGHFSKPWDIFFLGGTFHDDPGGKWHPEIGRDFELTNVDHVVRVFGAFSNQGYLINPGSATKVLDRMNDVMPESTGSDHALIQIQPEFNCFCFVPGMVFQIDGPSDIGEGITKFSNFLKMGGYVWADKLEDFNFFEWKERVQQ